MFRWCGVEARLFSLPLFDYRATATVIAVAFLSVCPSDKRVLCERMI